LKFTRLDTNHTTEIPGITKVTYYYPNKNSYDGTYFFYDLHRDVNNGGQCCVYHCSGTSGAMSTQSYIGTASSTGPSFVMTYSIGEAEASKVKTNTSMRTARHRVAISIANAQNNIYVDEVEDGQEGPKDLTMTSASSMSRSNGLFSTFEGHAYFFAQGTIDATKHSDVNNIFKTFLNAVKPNA